MLFDIEAHKIEHAVDRMCLLPILSSWFCIPLVHCLASKRKLDLRRDIAKRIRKLNERLDVVASEKHRYNFASLNLTEQILQRKTGPIIDESEVEGRNQLKRDIIFQLLTDSGIEGPNPGVISLVGFGGIGKTTLAQLIYKEVKLHFQKTLWVCVSNHFDEFKVACAILESILGSKPNLNELANVLLKIEEHLSGKRFLLVLDDVWEDDINKWKQVRDALKSGLQGSKILITTLKQSVASIMGNNDIIRVEELSANESWLLFSRFAFLGRDIQESQILEDIGKRIVEKCKGLPLAIKTLGNLLRFKRCREDSQIILDSELWEFEVGERNIFGPLRLSYYDLPHAIKQCFLYCAIFPEDHVFVKNDLIKLWMAQGYLTPSGRKEMENVGAEYFEILATRSFFQNFEKNYYGDIIRCKMHDIVHDFAQLMTKNECVAIEIDNSKDSVESFSEEARHLRLSYPMSQTLYPVDVDVCRYRKLRSLLVKDPSSAISSAVPKLFDELGCLRTVNLSGCGIGVVPSSVEKLVHLRYLNLSCNYFRELPKEIGKLYNLQTLDVSDCDCIEYADIGKLVNLRHFHNHGTNFIVVKGVERLSYLKTLDMFHAGYDGEACNLGDLRTLNHLSKFIWINWLGDVASTSDAKEANLKSKRNLVGLTLGFYARNEGRAICDEDVIEGLEPPSSLQSLRIQYYRARAPVFPSWIMALENLKRVCLWRCHKMEQLPPLWKLQSLEDLEKAEIRGIKRVGGEFIGVTESDETEASSFVSSSDHLIAFPKLKKLVFADMRRWEEWEDMPTSISVMPCLCSVSLISCPKLQALPSYLFLPRNLEELKISRSHILENRFHKETKKGCPKISFVHDVESMKEIQSYLF